MNITYSLSVMTRRNLEEVRIDFSRETIQEVKEKLYEILDKASTAISTKIISLTIKVDNKIVDVDTAMSIFHNETNAIKNKIKAIA